MKWTLAAKVTAASARVNVIDKITGRFIDFSPLSGLQDVSETFPPRCRRKEAPWGWTAEAQKSLA